MSLAGKVKASFNGLVINLHLSATYSSMESERQPVVIVGVVIVVSITVIVDIGEIRRRIRTGTPLPPQTVKCKLWLILRQARIELLIGVLDRL